MKKGGGGGGRCGGGWELYVLVCVCLCVCACVHACVCVFLRAVMPISIPITTKLDVCKQELEKMAAFITGASQIV